jgi:Protein of unknown function (DUF5818)
MHKAVIPLAFVLLMAMPMPGALPATSHYRTFMGNISDSMCGLKHMMAGKTPKECTNECVRMGAKYVLADEAEHKVYNLSDQAKAKPFAGENVRVAGTLKGDTIEVRSISAAR